jgi:integrase
MPRFSEFRRFSVVLLAGSCEHVKTTQELMRHAISRLTLDVYAQALTPAKRAAHQRAVELIRPVENHRLFPVAPMRE